MNKQWCPIAAGKQKHQTQQCAILGALELAFHPAQKSQQPMAVCHCEKAHQLVRPVWRDVHAAQSDSI